jgi:hypothetical protein
VTSSATLRKRLADLTAFVNALNALLEVAEPVQVTYSGPSTFVPRDGMETEASRRRLEVDRVAGRAAYAFAEAGSIIEWSPRGTMQTQPVNPATIWATILDSDPIVPVSLIFSCAAQATGVLEMKAEEAEEEERNPTRQPRPAAAPRVRLSHLAPVVKCAGGVLGTVIGAGILYWLGWR